MEFGLEEVRKVIEEIHNRTAAPACTLRINPEKKPELTDSKFGGLPYWDVEREYPRDSDGQTLVLLAQLNFDQMEVEEPLPETGMLQFFIRPDEMFGIDFDHPDVQDTFRVVYHESVDYNISKEEIEKLGVPDSSREEFQDYTPVQEELAVECVQDTCSMSFSDYRFDRMFKEVVKELWDVDLGEESIYEAVDYEVMDEIEEEYRGDEDEDVCCGHRMLGYPYFTQTDPREYQEEYRVYDTLLFQMDTESRSEEGWDYVVIWGDCGVGNFFINRRDLEKRDFSKVLYNWDCC